LRRKHGIRTLPQAKLGGKNWESNQGEKKGLERGTNAGGKGRAHKMGNGRSVKREELRLGKRAEYSSGKRERDGGGAIRSVQGGKDSVTRGPRKGAIAKKKDEEKREAFPGGGRASEWLISKRSPSLQRWEEAPCWGAFVKACLLAAERVKKVQA